MKRPTLLTPIEAAGILRRSPRTLAKWRAQGGKGLRYICVNNRFLYRLSDIDRFLNASDSSAHAASMGEDPLHEESASDFDDEDNDVPW